LVISTDNERRTDVIVAYITSAGRIGTAEKAWLDEARLTFFGVFGFSAR